MLSCAAHRGREEAKLTWVPLRSLTLSWESPTSAAGSLSDLRSATQGVPRCPISCSWLRKVKHNGACLGAQYWKVGAERLGVQGPLQLCEEYRTSLGYIRPCIKKNKTQGKARRIMWNLWKLQGVGEVIVNRNGSPGACWVQEGRERRKKNFCGKGNCIHMLWYVPEHLSFSLAPLQDECIFNVHDLAIWLNFAVPTLTYAFSPTQLLAHCPLFSEHGDWASPSSICFFWTAGSFLNYEFNSSCMT